MICLLLKILFGCFVAALIVIAFGFWALNKIAAWQDEAEQMTGEDE